MIINLRFGVHYFCGNGMSSYLVSKNTNKKLCHIF